MSLRAPLVACLLLVPLFGIGGAAVAMNCSLVQSAYLESGSGEPLSRRIQAYKTDIVEATGISKSSLHFLLGGLVFVVAGLLLMRFTPHWAWWAGGITLSIALLLELVDWSDAALVGKRLTFGHTLKDILLTCAVAAVYLALRPLFDRLRRQP